MSRTANARAAAVSRALAIAGIRPLPSGTPRGREGVRVTRGHSAAAPTTVGVYIELRGQRAEIVEAVRSALTGAGYEIADHTWEYGHTFYVTRPEGGSS